ncbi:MAG: hypothetical protein CMH82_14165 [Nocardioides sp.]|nr:hypothetical protein [Nocardioides sp.]
MSIRFDDALTTRGTGDVSDAEAWFDRAYFNIFAGIERPAVVLGGAHHPNADRGRGVSDGYIVVLHEGQQRNLRFSEPGAVAGRIGPLQWSVVEPYREWSLDLRSEDGVELSARFLADTVPNFLEPIVANQQNTLGTRFAHFFQRGHYEGELRLDDQTWSLDGWTGIRDRSRGLREARARLGMHVWGHFRTDDGSHLAFNYNEHRDGTPSHLDGGLMAADRLGPRVVDVRHHFEVNDARELMSGSMLVATDDGSTYDIDIQSLSGGIHMAGAGYAGWHGVPRGSVVEGETWTLDDTFDTSDLGLALVDKPCAVRCGKTEETTIFEFALSRSPSYSYQPNMPAAGRGHG